MVNENLDNVVHLSLDNRNPQLEKEHNIGLGDPYRVKIAGINPCDSVTYDGLLTQISFIPKEQGNFALVGLTLEDGFVHDFFSSKSPFDEEVFGSENFVGFGRIKNESRFYGIRDKIKGESE